MAATNFCEVYDCRTTEFFRIDRFTLPNEVGYFFKIDGTENSSMDYYIDFGWYGSATNETLIPGHGIRLDTDGDGTFDTSGYKLGYSSADPIQDQEFCHEGLGCTGFGNGTGIILPHRDESADIVFVDIPIPSQIAEDGAPIYSDEQDEFFGDGDGGGGGGGEDCFVAGTKVKMSNGLEKNIEDIQIGEEVLSYNIHTKKLELKKVTELYTQVHDLVGGDITVKTRFNNGIELHNTIANPFWSKDKGFVAADAERCNIKNPYVKETNNGKDTEQLKVGDTLYYHDGEELQEVMVTEIEHILEPYIRTYDIKVQDNHTFFANGILTHNSGGGGLYGCTDSSACNYNSQATVDDGTCTYPSLCDDGQTMACPGECPEDEPLYPNGPNFLCCTPGTHQGTVITPGEVWANTGTTVENYITDDEEDVFNHNHGNNENLEACNQVDCSNPEPGFANVHFDAMCIGAIGQYGVHGHNVVFQYYYRQAYLYGQQGDLSLTHYPYVVSRTTPIYDEDLEIYNADSLEYIDRHIHEDDLDIAYNRYFDPIPVSDPQNEETWNDGDLFNEWGMFMPDEPEGSYNNGVLNPVLDRWQKGVDAEGNTLYDLPVYKKLTCNDVETKIGLDTTEYTGKISDYDLGGDIGGFVKSPFYTENVDSLGYQLEDSVVEGIDVCGGSDLIEEAFDLLFSNPMYEAILIRIFAQYGGDVWFQDIDENYEIPSGELGFGLNQSGVDDVIVLESGPGVIAYLQDVFINDTALNRDVLIRIGFPLPPVSLWALVGDSDCPDDFRTSYLKIVDEFIGELKSLQFFSGFEIPGVTLEPTMKNELDVLKGIDLREENLNACNHIEFMILPGGDANGDGIYYKVNEVPDMYFETPYDGNVGKENYVREFNCNTELSTNVQFNKIRAVCKDGSSVEMAEAGANGNQSYIINHGGTDEFFNTGVEACNSQLKINSNQDLYHLSDYDGKESLGIFSFESENKGSENFVNTKDTEFDQYPLRNSILNSDGRAIRYIYEHENFPNNDYINLYAAEFWSLITSQDFDSTENHKSYLVSPYWSLRNSECFSKDKCLVVDTMKPLIVDDVDGYDSRQGQRQFLVKDYISRVAYRRKQQFKVSFMMKTIDLYDDVDLKNTGIHTIVEFVNSSPSNTHIPNLQKIKANQYRTSQCSQIGKNPNHFSDILTEEVYCKEARASFTNTVMNKWEKMEYVFEVDVNNNLEVDNYVGLYITPLEFAKQYYDLYADREADNYLLNDIMSVNSSIILVDNIEFKESHDFHPDVDVRKKKASNDYGLVSLMEYYDKNKPNVDRQEFQDTLAPLEAQFYFYPRFPYDDVLSPSREILMEQFAFGLFYISDVDWGDGSPIEFTDEPERLGPNKMLTHTYETNGIFEIKGTMFKIVAQDYKWAFSPENKKYEGNLGVGYNQKFTIRININEGLDEDFTYFGSDGFSFIPYKNTTPILGGNSKESIYYKSLKRNLGIVEGYREEGGFNLLSDSDLATKDFHGYPSQQSATEETLGDDGGWFKVDYIDGELEYLMSHYVVALTPESTYEESFELKHDGTLDSLKITFFNSLNGHRLVDATIEDLGVDSDGNIHKRVSAQFTLEPDDTQIRAIDFRNFVGDFTFLAVKNVSFKLVNEDNINTTLVDVNYASKSDRLKTEIAFQKMDSSFNDTGAFQLLQFYQQPADITYDNTIAYTSTLPFPRYYQEFNILNLVDIANIETLEAWINVGRTDISSFIERYVDGEEDIPIVNENSDYYNPPIVYYNPTVPSITEQYTGKQFGQMVEELGKSIGDMDIQNLKYYNKPKTMSSLLGFNTITDDTTTTAFFGFVGVADSYTDSSIDDLALNKTIEWKGVGCIDYQEFYDQVSDFGYYPYIDDIYENNCLRNYTNNHFHHEFIMDEPTEQGVERATHACAAVFGGEPYNYNAVIASIQVYQLDEEDLEYYDWYIFMHDSDFTVRYFIYGCQVENFSVENIYDTNNPDSFMYWKNIIPQNYSIFNRKGIETIEVGGISEFQMPQRDIENEYYNQETVNQQEWVYDSNQGGVIVDYCDGDPNGNCKWENFFDIRYFSDNRYGMAVAAESSAMIWLGDRWAGTSTNNVLDLTENNYYFEMFDLDGDGVDETPGGLFAKCQILGPDDDERLVEFCHPALGCTGFMTGTGITLPRGGTCTHEIFPQDCATGCIHTSELGASYGFPPTQGGATCFNPIIDARLYGATNYHYPVLPRHGNDGKYLENDYPYDYIPAPLEGPISDKDEYSNNLLLNLSFDEVDVNVLVDESGNDNKGHIIGDFKPKFKNDTLKVEKTKKFNVIKKTIKDRAF